MTNELDMNVVAAEVSVQLIKDTMNATFQKISKAAKFVYDVHFTDFEEHMLAVYQRIATVKIITSRDQPVNFSSVYTSSGFTCGETKFSDDKLIEVLISGKRCVLSGNGGAGKTFMMRNIWLEIFKKKQKKVPILVELRKLNSLSTYDVASFIRANSFGNINFDESTFQHFCEQGAFIFLLDGFDEVVKEKREDLERQILALSRKFTECGLIVSGRPDDRFDAWSDFYTFKAEPFDYNQFRVLINKVPFDDETKGAFLKVATEGFFNEHQSFLSNPLLSLMMLLTFRDNAEIPTRLSTFYENCFNTLYTQHDALKESFNRKKSLDQLRFKRLFAAFSLVTYLATRPSLDAAEYIAAIERAKGIAGIDLGVDEISHDFLESVNLLVKEGSTYSYIHRSFQEFFAAYCVSGVISSNEQGDVLTKFAKRSYDNTLRLTYEMHPKLVENTLIIPRYETFKLENRLPRKTQKSLPFNAAARAGLSITVVFRTSAQKTDNKASVFISGFRIDWREDYEILSAAVKVLRARAQQYTRSLFDNILDVTVMGIMREVSSELLDNDPVDLDFEEHMSIKILFDPDSANVSIEGDLNDDSAHVNDVLEKCKNYFVLNCHKIEKAIIYNNKSIVELSESILSVRGKYKSILGEIIL